MGFQRVDPAVYPPRQWALIGYPGDGKSTFAIRMRGDVLVIDSDHRIGEVVRQYNLGHVLRLSADAQDNTNPQKIQWLLDENMPGSAVRTIVIDSLTAIIAPLVTAAMLANDAGQNKNRIAAFKEKAMTMRSIQDSVTSWGKDTLWIYHYRDSRDAKAQAITTTSISVVELARLRRSLNMQLSVVRDGDKRGVRVDWARVGRAGLTIWDDSGSWVDMPERIERAVYDNITPKERAAIESDTPSTFSGPDHALDWGMSKGIFRAHTHALNAYNKLKFEHNPQSASEMFALWIADVERRVALSEEQSIEVEI